METKREFVKGDKVIITSNPFMGIYGEVTDFIFNGGRLFIQIGTMIGEKFIEPQCLKLILPATQNCEQSEENYRIMKPQIALTPDQMHELQSLGLDCSDASMCWINGVLVADCDCKVMTALRAMNAPIPAYTLEDIMMKLPPLIDGAWLTIQKVDNSGLLLHRKVIWGIAYMTCEYDSEDTLSTHSTGARKAIMTNDLITGLVDMLEWVLQNHPDKIK